ncbi:tryptophan synthase beta subunit-like PLP-dependent enzyme [Phlyctochytrium arcticum]|nr:tryptophan synthase beta subunit-like PLP-dependent enzyme [Phlyctochytrium arcticum]
MRDISLGEDDKGVEKVAGEGAGDDEDEEDDDRRYNFVEKGGIDYLKMILNARVYDVAIESPLTFASKLSGRFESKLYLKREDLQPSVFSFKSRGAFNRIYHLSDEERARGVCCVSAGNHAQGVALAAGKLGIKAVIVLPKFAPEVKIDAVRRLGAEVILAGDDFDAAKAECFKLVEERNLVFIPPFDDPYVIAGQGTVGVEILRQLRQDRLDAIFVCCGGGGLLAGIGAFVKRIRPDIRIIGVNTVDSDGMYQSLSQGQVVELPEAGLFADGTAVRKVGTETHRLCAKFVDDFVLVTNDEICAAIKDVFDDTRSILEPAGALSVAGCKRYLSSNPQLKDGVFVCVTSGANMNFDRLRFVAERARIGEGKEALMSCLIPEKPGSLRALYDHIYPRFVTEFSYRYSDPTNAHIYTAFEVSNGATEVKELIADLHSSKTALEAIDITDNEMAKTHARYLAGGRSSTVGDEVLYRFRFPERPGALKKFMRLLEDEWNVSLFHYRNNGADIGRVLAGLQVPLDQRDRLQAFLQSLEEAGYFFFINETDNPVYKHFLR